MFDFLKSLFTISEAADRNALRNQAANSMRSLCGINRYCCSAFFTVLFLVLTGSKGFAQLCTGSLGDPVISINFGSGTATHAGALPSGETSYTYSSADFPTDGSYTIENTTAGAGNVWWSTTDHTGNIGGYMMVVNASVSKTDYFYKSPVGGLCPGTTYEFAAWVVNLLRSRDISPPDITFTISTTSGTVLGTYDTGTIPLTSSGATWKQYGLYFTTPANVSDVVIQMTNNSAGGAPANDLALDDITFRPCGPTMVASFNSSSAVTTQTTCAGSNQTFTLSSAVSTGYTNPAYQWQVNSGNGWTNITGATATTYTVTSPTTAGTYQYRLVSAEAANIGSTSCQVASNLLTLTVTAVPVAAFTVAANTCLGDATVFTDNSISNGLTITSWLWDFGDGQTSTQQNPTHAYTSAGNFTVILTVSAGSSSCTATPVTKTIHIGAKPVASFTASTPNCAGQAVTFSDQSTTSEGTITQWVWNFGDQSASQTLTTNASFTHTFLAAGTYTVTLQVTTNAGCVNTSTQTIVIHPLPVADFSLPDVCLSDAYAKFTDKSSIADNTQSGFIYLWNFGDQNATAANPNTSTVQNPQHKYTQTGNYIVTLTVTSASGCVSAVKSQTFTVNGAIPVASFTAENNGSLCSSDSVVFDNTSTIDFGNITKVVFYYDYTNAPNDSTVFYRSLNQIPSNNKFSHFYGLFNSPASKSYDVKMIVYSGATCFSSVDRTITINANPIVTLSTIASICQEASAVQITQNLNGFTGTGTFTGTGVSSTGLFNPATAGVGTFTISYLFTATSGCTYSSSQQVAVYRTPAVTLPANVYVLEGGQSAVKVTVTGDSLTYKWTPSTGLSADNIINPVISPTADTQYTLTVTSAQGCSASAQVEVHVLKAPVVPNAFTPNNDGINDTWNIKYLDSYPNCTVEIYNRYGVKLFYSVGYPVPWDGTFNGAPLPVGVYYYIINPKSGRSAVSGSLTIIR
ncbi:PKD domain-containing protein [Mucilaginibacter arboris]|uniref:PKD domain-containing protein n=1 Tax=Mucilaginibacter arboris TaxID=2682090 RepID=A0A7K1SX35_9SPHI|nr:PKD domain-containing protein [Mucilaginibacter arboris]MVN21891.1 PKD domain-containing protein [Mucilaginibacter arboris]